MNDFTQKDSTEVKLGQTVSSMDPQTLLAYCQESHKQIYGYPMAVEFGKAVGILRWLKKTYGSEAGEMLKWIFSHYNGNYQGQKFSLSMCSTGWSWWLDQVRHEVIQAKRQATRNQQPLMGFATGADFLRS